MGALKVIIVGGGLSGALLANGLRNNGVDFIIYERDEVSSSREGYQIRLGPGAQAGFAACLTDAHIEAITSKLGKSSGSQATAPSIYTTKFEEVLDLSLVPSYSKSAAINRVVLRDTLLEPIKKSGKIQYGKAFARYEIVPHKDGTERVKVWFQDGSHDICDVLVGSDGANSKINKQLGLNNIHLLDSHWSFLSKGNLPYDRMLQLPAKLRQGPIIVMSKNMSLYYALYLPEDTSKAGAADSKTALQYDEEAASFYWGLNVPVSSLPPFKHASEIQNPRETILKQIEDWAPEFHQMLRVGEDDPKKNDMTITQHRASSQPKADWRAQGQRTGNGDEGHPRVWVMGDAIHAMQPNRGQGGNQALTDCADMLPHLLHLNSLAKSGPARPTFDEVKDACNRYEMVMIPRAFEWVKKSGGTSFPSIDFDGWLGVFVRIVAKLVLPLLKLYYTVFSKSNE